MVSAPMISKAMMDFVLRHTHIHDPFVSYCLFIASKNITNTVEETDDQFSPSETIFRYANFEIIFSTEDFTEGCTIRYD